MLRSLQRRTDTCPTDVLGVRLPWFDLFDILVTFALFSVLSSFVAEASGKMSFRKVAPMTLAPREDAVTVIIDTARESQKSFSRQINKI